VDGGSDTLTHERNGGPASAVSSHRCWLWNPSPWSTVLFLLHEKLQKRSLPSGWGALLQIVRPGILELHDDETITLSVEPTPGDIVQTHKWSAQEIERVDVNRISKKFAFKIGLVAWSEIALIVGVPIVLLATGYILYLVFRHDAQYAGKGLVFSIQIAVLLGILVGFWFGFLGTLSEALWSRSEFVFTSATERDSFLLRAADQATLVGQLEALGIQQTDEASGRGDTTSPNGAPAFESREPDERGATSTCTSGPVPYGQISCACCGQTFYGELRADGTCPLCGGQPGASSQL